MLKFKPTSANEEKEYENHLSEASEEFLNKPIPFILKGPIFIIFFVLTAALIYSFYVQINVKVTGYLTAKGEEHIIVCPFEGTITKLNINDNDKIKINSTICEIKSNYIFNLKNKLSQLNFQTHQYILKAIWLKEFEKAMRNAEKTRAIKIPELSLDLPEIPNYPSIENEIKNYVPNSSDQIMINSDFEILFKTLENNVDLIVSEFTKANKNYRYWKTMEKENKELLQKKIITKLEYNTSVQTMNSYKSQMEQLKENYESEFINMFKLLNDTNKDIANNLISIIDSKNELVNSISGIDYKKNNYSVFSKYSGVVSEIYVNLFDYIPQQTPIVKIVRDDYPVIGLMYVSGADVRKLKIGQTATIKFNAYPYQEYGVQLGEVIFISSDIKEIQGLGNVYEVHIGFNVENPKIKIQYGYSGISEIIVGKKRLIELVFSPLSKFFDKFRENN